MPKLEERDEEEVPTAGLRVVKAVHFRHVKALAAVLIGYVC